MPQCLSGPSLLPLMGGAWSVPLPHSPWWDAGWELGVSRVWGVYSSLKRTAGSSLWDRAVRTLSNFS